MRQFEGDDLHATIQTPNSPRQQFTGSTSQDVYNILNTLQSSNEIQVDLPNLYTSDDTKVVKPYTSAVLTELYIQCYEKQLWHFCDLIADTWIRALQYANRRRSYSTENIKTHLWRQNKALEKKFAEKKKGFKKDVWEFALDIEDPKMDSDATAINPERLRDLYAHTSPNCGARLLWADAMALSGRKLEHEMAREPDVWPADLFFDVMCTALRMVGRKLTLKIEEAYEGAWCRYHEHGKQGQPCYRKLAWIQQFIRDEEGTAEDIMISSSTRARVRARQTASGDQESSDGGAADDDFDSGDTDAEH